MMPLRSRHLTLALLLSILLHLTLLSAPGWSLPAAGEDDDEPPVMIEAHLAAPTAGRSVAAQRSPPPSGMRRSKPFPRVSPAPVDEPMGERVAAALSAAPTPQPVAEVPEAAPARAEPAPAKVEPEAPTAPISPLPSRGHIRFLVMRGDQGMVIGQSLHRWKHDGKTYTLDTLTETTGLAALFRPVQVTQRSVGEIGEEGLRPREFRTAKNGVAGDAANFDWSPMTLMLTAGNPSKVPLKRGAQDMLSMFYQLSARYPVGPGDLHEVMVATGRKFERYAFEVLREEMLPTRQGDLRTLHLRAAAGVEAIDVWSGLDLRGLPVKIRYTDRQGDSFDQVADEIEFDGMPGLSGK